MFTRNYGNSIFLLETKVGELPTWPALNFDTCVCFTCPKCGVALIGVLPAVWGVKICLF